MAKYLFFLNLSILNFHDLEGTGSKIAAPGGAWRGYEKADPAAGRERRRRAPPRIPCAAAPQCFVCTAGKKTKCYQSTSNCLPVYQKLFPFTGMGIPVPVNSLRPPEIGKIGHKTQIERNVCKCWQTFLMFSRNA